MTSLDRGCDFDNALRAAFYGPQARRTHPAASIALWLLILALAVLISRQLFSQQLPPPDAYHQPPIATPIGDTP